MVWHGMAWLLLHYFRLLYLSIFCCDLSGLIISVHYFIILVDSCLISPWAGISHTSIWLTPLFCYLWILLCDSIYCCYCLYVDCSMTFVMPCYLVVHSHK